MAAPVSRALSSPIATRFTQPITSIADIEALERLPYDSLVPASNFLHLFEATAGLHPGRPALTLVHIAVDSDHQDRAKALAESLATFPQTYRIETRSS